MRAGLFRVQKCERPGSPGRHKLLSKTSPTAIGLGEDGEPHIYLNNEDGDPRIDIKVDEDGTPSIATFDEAGKLTWRAPVEGD